MRRNEKEDEGPGVRLLKLVVNLLLLLLLFCLSLILQPDASLLPSPSPPAGLGQWCCKGGSILLLLLVLPPQPLLRKEAQ